LNKISIFLDLDGVIASFSESFCKAANLPPPSGYQEVFNPWKKPIEEGEGESQRIMKPLKEIPGFEDVPKAIRITEKAEREAWEKFVNGLLSRTYSLARDDSYKKTAEAADKMIIEWRKRFCQ